MASSNYCDSNKIARLFYFILFFQNKNKNADDEKIRRRENRKHREKTIDNNRREICAGYFSIYFTIL
jgi:hypothetical protein